MSTALDRIIAYKHDEVARLKRERTEAGFLSDAKQQLPPRGFAMRMTTITSSGDNALICEMKRKSPSAGEILPGADPCEIAAQYERGGAACLSVLTDVDFFQGARVLHYKACTSLEKLEVLQTHVELLINKLFSRKGM
ncbi:MAG: hypothetical protein VXW22_07315 [Pseudomonadota bacterium]|nr:hypothetical protein [Pseudomonadota bacterium]